MQVKSLQPTAVAALASRQPTTTNHASTNIITFPAAPNAIPQQQQLLAYPVMPLNYIFKTYLNTVEPLLSAESFEQHRKLTADFQLNEGAELHKLLEHAASVDRNWLTKRWVNAEYLQYRAPLTVHSSPCMAFPLQKFRSRTDFLRFVAKVIYGLGEFKKLVDSKQLAVVKIAQLELDNGQYGKVYGTVRKPQKYCDCLEQHADSKYVVVICRNSFFKLPIYTSEQELLSVQALTTQLLHIHQSAGSAVSPGMGILTHDTRDNWAEAYQLLRRYPQNSEVLQTIERCLFTVSLDEPVPVVRGEERSIQAAQLLHGGGLTVNSCNRWMDKTIQLIVNPNGMAGFCVEQAPADCHPIAMMLDYIQTKLTDRNFGNTEGDQDTGEPATMLYFTPPDRCIDFWLGVAKRALPRTTKALKLHVFDFAYYGKHFIKAYNLNPDSYIQMALQLAYFRLYRELTAHSETAHLRLFDGGRTETIRSTSLQACRFVQTMVNPKSTAPQCYMALGAAVDAHVQYTKLALTGRGVDRYLFGLYCMAREHGKPLPNFFRSEGYEKSMCYRVCSSHVATSHEAFMACGPLLANGYSCSYNPRERNMIFAISSGSNSRHTDARRYGAAIRQALLDMRELLLHIDGARGDNACKCNKI